MSKKILDPHLWFIEDTFSSIYNVPVYQRPYSWDTAEVSVLLEDIFESYFSPTKNEGYFTGNIIIHDKGESVDGKITKYEIIDGQQRITTFSLILLALYSLALTKNVRPDDATLIYIKNSLWKSQNREMKKDLRTVNLNSIEKKCFSELYDYCFDEPTKVVEYCKKYKCSSSFEERVISNFNFIYKSFEDRLQEIEDILSFSDYILRYVQFIVIESTCSDNKVFSMFESINSKGKKLEDIDLIKTYIFSQLDENSYSTYLEKWGQLIIKTHDNLYDYLYNYVKAFLSFYRQNINIINFKSISRKELLSYYHVNDVATGLKKLLDDMYDRVDFYNCLSSAEDAYNLVKSGKFRFYYKVFTEISYKHPKALFLRTLIEFSEGKLSKAEVTDIIIETVKFMLKFLSIGNRDSKDAITVFSKIMNDTYSSGGVSRDIVLYYIKDELLRQGISAEKTSSDLDSMDAYSVNRKLSISLLSLYESTTKKDNGKVHVSYDQAYTILNSFSDAFSLDHLLVQTPDKDCADFKYYKNENQNTLVLKPGNDFPKESVKDGMDYDEFTSIVLNRLGNLRVYYKDKNSGRQNTLVVLNDNETFYTYKDINTRSKNIITTLLDNCLQLPDIDIAKIKATRKIESSLPKMDKLIEFGIVKPGDKLYITVKPAGSEATLIDSKFVDYNGKKMTLNDWGCEVTGWHSIRIYAYTAIVGEIETIHSKRLKYIEEHNEEASQ